MDCMLARVDVGGGLELECLSELEAMFLTQDVELYFRSGDSLSPGATVFDVGANIGLFSARLLQLLDGVAAVYAFEPIAATHALLSRNLDRLFPGRARAFGYGLGAREEEVEFTFYPKLSAMSAAGGARAHAAEKTRLTAIALAMIGRGTFLPQLQLFPPEALEQLIDGYLDSAMIHQTERARLRRLSSVIVEERVQ